ncbi:DUF3108 domain-containing protein [Pseudoxanthomonas mexicana]|uniref:DUF3108 domain-containing protein n=1 Tax=Pseudoxanthomonas mexicana TaxID=128785 RepID=UPI00398B34A4
MTTLRRPLAALLLAGACAPALAVEAFTATYQANALGMQGEGRMVLAPQGNRWQYSLTVKNQAVDLSQQTVFDEHAGQLRPLSSSDNSRFLIKKKAVNTTYDWGKAQATWSGDVKPDRAGPVPLQKGDMDALLVNLAIVRDVAAGKPLTYRMVENGRAKPMTYQVAGREKVTVGGRTHDATRVQRTDGDRQTIVWVVNDIPVPARILQRENGSDAIDLKLTGWH